MSTIDKQINWKRYLGENGNIGCCKGGMVWDNSLKWIANLQNKLQITIRINNK